MRWQFFIQRHSDTHTVDSCQIRDDPLVAVFSNNSYLFAFHPHLGKIGSQAVDIRLKGTIRDRYIFTCRDFFDKKCRIIAEKLCTGADHISKIRDLSHLIEHILILFTVHALRLLIRIQVLL